MIITTITTVMQMGVQVNHVVTSPPSVADSNRPLSKKSYHDTGVGVVVTAEGECGVCARMRATLD